MKKQQNKTFELQKASRENDINVANRKLNNDSALTFASGTTLRKGDQIHKSFVDDSRDIKIQDNEEDITKLGKLQIINANARFQLINANQQLLDFQLNVNLQS